MSSVLGTAFLIYSSGFVAKWYWVSSRYEDGWKCFHYRRRVETYVSYFVMVLFCRSERLCISYPATIDIFINQLWCVNAKVEFKSQVYYPITWDFLPFSANDAGVRLICIIIYLFMIHQINIFYEDATYLEALRKFTENWMILEHSSLEKIKMNTMLDFLVSLLQRAVVLKYLKMLQKMKQHNSFTNGVVGEILLLSSMVHDLLIHKSHDALSRYCKQI